MESKLISTCHLFFFLQCTYNGTWIPSGMHVDFGMMYVDYWPKSMLHSTMWAYPSSSMCTQYMVILMWSLFSSVHLFSPFRLTAIHHIVTLFIKKYSVPVGTQSSLPDVMFSSQDRLLFKLEWTRMSPFTNLPWLNRRIQLVNEAKLFTTWWIGARQFHRHRTWLDKPYHTKETGGSHKKLLKTLMNNNKVRYAYNTDNVLL